VSPQSRQSTNPKMADEPAVLLILALLAPEDGARASAMTLTHRHRPHRGIQKLQRVVGQGVAAHPLPLCWQHHAFLGTDHPACQFANPALQSYGIGGGVGQPLPA